MSNSDRSRVIHLADTRARLPGPAGEHSVSILRRGSLNLKLSLPAAPNQQTPHEQDEIYLIIAGKAVLFHDGKQDAFEPGDVMFVAAGTEHSLRGLYRGPRRMGCLLWADWWRGLTLWKLNSPAMASVSGVTASPMSL